MKLPYFIWLCLFIGLAAGSPALQAEAPQRHARLVVLVVVDQMRGDYLPRYSPYLTSGGFARLMKEGADFRSAYYSYGSTATAPGHATLSTGRLPRQHGIVANDWFLEPGATKPRQAIDDSSCRIVGPGGPDSDKGLSPINLIGPTIGDELKLADLRSRVFSIALKDRAAILLGGKKPDAALWWDSHTGQYVTSTYYMQKLPTYAADFDEKRWCDQFVGKSWELLLPASAYADCHQTEPRWLADDGSIGPAFPHALPKVSGKPDKAFYRSLLATPYGNDIVMEMVQRVLEGEKLGQRDATDLLCVGFSSNDYSGHMFGPDSAEMKDITLRTDRQILRLLGLLDRQVGPGNYLLALTADHGVKPVPNLAQSVGLGGGRVDLAAIVKNLEAALKQAVGPPPGARYVAGVELPWIYLDRSTDKLDAAARKKLLDAAATHLRSLEGIAGVFTADELAGPSPRPDDRELYFAWRSYNANRSGQLYVQLAPYWYEVSDKTTGHSTSYSHDRHVPILLYGPGVRPGRYFAPADPMDIVVTLSALMGIEMPVDAMGRVLHEALTN